MGSMPSVVLREQCQLLTEVFTNMGIEPALQSLSGKSFHQRSSNTEDGAKIDIRAQDVWDKSKRSTFLDVRVVNFHVLSKCTPFTEACYRRHEQEKRRAYKNCITEVEHENFTLLVPSSSRCCGPSCTVVLKRLAGLTSKKHRQLYSSTLSFIQCRLTFGLINSAMACLRAPRSSHHAIAQEISFSNNPLDLIHAEAQLSI